MEGLWASIRLAPSLEGDPLFQRNLQRAADEIGMARARLQDAMSALGGHGEVNDADIAYFRTLMLELLEKESPARTKIYLSTIIERIEVGVGDVRIEGHIDDLRRAVESSSDTSGGPAMPEVRRYVRRWRCSQSGANWSLLWLPCFGRETGSFVHQQRNLVRLLAECASEFNGFVDKFPGEITGI